MSVCECTRARALVCACLDVCQCFCVYAYVLYAEKSGYWGPVGGEGGGEGSGAYSGKQYAVSVTNRQCNLTGF